MVEKNLPPAVNTLPEKRTDFTDAADKANYVNLMIKISNEAMILADERWSQYLYP